MLKKMVHTYKKVLRNYSPNCMGILAKTNTLVYILLLRVSHNYFPLCGAKLKLGYGRCKDFSKLYHWNILFTVFVWSQIAKELFFLTFQIKKNSNKYQLLSVNSITVKLVSSKQISFDCFPVICLSQVKTSPLAGGDTTKGCLHRFKLVLSRKLFSQTIPVLTSLLF